MWNSEPCKVPAHQRTYPRLEKRERQKESAGTKYFQEYLNSSKFNSCLPDPSRGSVVWGSGTETNSLETNSLRQIPWEQVASPFDLVRTCHLQTPSKDGWSSKAMKLQGQSFKGKGCIRLVLVHSEFDSTRGWGQRGLFIKHTVKKFLVCKEWVWWENPLCLFMGDGELVNAFKWRPRCYLSHPKLSVWPEMPTRLWIQETEKTCQEKAIDLTLF